MHLSKDKQVFYVGGGDLFHTEFEFYDKVPVLERSWAQYKIVDGSHIRNPDPDKHDEWKYCIQCRYRRYFHREGMLMREEITSFLGRFTAARAYPALFTKHTDWNKDGEEADLFKLFEHIEYPFEPKIANLKQFRISHL